MQYHKKLPILPTVLCEKSPNNFDQCFRPFLSDFATMKFYKVEFTYTSGADKTTRKLQKYFDVAVST